MTNELVPLLQRAAEAAAAPATAAAPAPAKRARGARVPVANGDYEPPRRDPATLDAAAAVVQAVLALNHRLIEPHLVLLWQALGPIAVSDERSAGAPAAHADDAIRTHAAGALSDVVDLYARLRQSARPLAALADALASSAMQEQLGAAGASAVLPVWPLSVSRAVARAAATLPPGQLAVFMAELRETCIRLLVTAPETHPPTWGGGLAAGLLVELAGVVWRHSVTVVGADAVLPAEAALWFEALVRPWLRRVGALDGTMPEMAYAEASLRLLVALTESVPTTPLLSHQRLLAVVDRVMAHATAAVPAYRHATGAPSHAAALLSLGRLLLHRLPVVDDASAGAASSSAAAAIAALGLDDGTVVSHRRGTGEGWQSNHALTTSPHRRARLLSRSRVGGGVGTGTVARITDRALSLLLWSDVDGTQRQTEMDRAAFAALVRELPSLAHFASSAQQEALLRAVLVRAIECDSAEAEVAGPAAAYTANGLLRVAAFYEVSEQRVFLLLFFSFAGPPRGHNHALTGSPSGRMSACGSRRGRRSNPFRPALSACWTASPQTPRGRRSFSGGAACGCSCPRATSFPSRRCALSRPCNASWPT